MAFLGWGQVPRSLESGDEPKHPPPLDGSPRTESVCLEDGFHGIWDLVGGFPGEKVG